MTEINLTLDCISLTNDCSSSVKFVSIIYVDTSTIMTIDFYFVLMHGHIVIKRAGTNVLYVKEIVPDYESSM